MEGQPGGKLWYKDDDEDDDGDTSIFVLHFTRFPSVGWTRSKGCITNTPKSYHAKLYFDYMKLTKNSEFNTEIILILMSAGVSSQNIKCIFFVKTLLLLWNLRYDIYSEINCKKM